MDYQPDQLKCFSIRRWIEGCEAYYVQPAKSAAKSFSIRRWIEGCEAHCRRRQHNIQRGVSVSADGSKGVKPLPNSEPSPTVDSFSIRRWIEGCEASCIHQPNGGSHRGFSIRRWIEGCEAFCRASPNAAHSVFQYPQMDRRV